MSIHRPQTQLKFREEETQNTYSHITIKAKQPAPTHNGNNNKQWINKIILTSERTAWDGVGVGALIYSKTCVQRPLKNRQNKYLNDRTEQNRHFIWT